MILLLCFVFVICLFDRQKIEWNNGLFAVITVIYKWFLKKGEKRATDSGAINPMCSF